MEYMAGEHKYIVSDLREVDLAEANLFDTFLRRATLIRAALRGAYLRRVNFEKADLSGANLRGLRGSTTIAPVGRMREVFYISCFSHPRFVTFPVPSRKAEHYILDGIVSLDDRACEDKSMNWEALSAISTLVATIVIVITAMFAVVQLVEMRRSRRLSLLLELFDQLSSPQMRETRLFLHNDLPDDPSQLTPQHFLRIDEALSPLERIGILIEQGQIEAQLVYDLYGGVIIRLWNRVSPSVEYQRRRRGSAYRQRSELLARNAQAYFQNKNRAGENTLYRYADNMVLLDPSNTESTETQ